MTDVLTAEYFCDLIGVATVETASLKKENSIEGDVEEYGQKSISTLSRNLLNVDEILRLPATKLLVNLRGNKPLLLDKVIYTEHPFSHKLQDTPISGYKPKWTRNNEKVKQITSKKSDKENKTEEKPKKENTTWENF